MHLRHTRRFGRQPLVAVGIRWQRIDGVLDALKAIDRIKSNIEPCVPSAVNFFHYARWRDPIVTRCEPGHHGIAKIDDGSDLIGDLDRLGNGRVVLGLGEGFKAVELNL